MRTLCLCWVARCGCQELCSCPRNPVPVLLLAWLDPCGLPHPRARCISSTAGPTLAARAACAPARRWPLAARNAFRRRAKPFPSPGPPMHPAGVLGVGAVPGAGGGVGVPAGQRAGGVRHYERAGRPARAQQQRGRHGHHQALPAPHAAHAAHAPAGAPDPALRGLFFPGSAASLPALRGLFFPGSAASLPALRGPFFPGSAASLPALRGLFFPGSSASLPALRGLIVFLPQPFPDLAL
jgi:hypothetical protein